MASLLSRLLSTLESRRKTQWQHQRAALSLQPRQRHRSDLNQALLRQATRWCSRSEAVVEQQQQEQQEAATMHRSPNMHKQQPRSLLVVSCSTASVMLTSTNVSVRARSCARERASLRI